MAKTVAAAGRYPYGICGFLIQSAVLKDGTVIKDARIQKQRNSYDYDIIADGTIYPSLRITGLNTQGSLLDYNETDDVLSTKIKPGHFYVRSMNEQGDHGFAIKFFDNKVILADGRHLYNLVPPTCTLPKPPLGTIVFNSINEGDTVITGFIVPATSAGLNTSGMTITVLINSVQYTSDVNPDGTFSITVPALQPGSYSATVQSDYYQSTNSTVNVPGDDDNVLQFFLPASSFVQESDSSFSSVLPGTSHTETDYILQTQYSTGQVFNGTLSYNTSTNDIKVNQTSAKDVNLLMITNNLYVKNVQVQDWINQNGYYTLSIPQSEHNKVSNIVLQLAEQVSGTEYRISSESVIIDSSSNITISVINAVNCKIVISGS